MIVETPDARRSTLDDRRPTPDDRRLTCDERGMRKPWERFVSTDTTLGKGGYGTVRIMIDRRTSRKVACKIMKLPEDEDLTPAVEGESQAHGRARTIDYTSVREVGALLALQGMRGIPHVVAVWPDQKANVYVVMEKMTCSLLDLMQKAPGGKLDVQTTRVIVGHLCRIMCEINHAGFMHRDLKPENVMLKASEGGARVQAYVIDFGLSRTMSTPVACCGAQAAETGRRPWSPTAATRWYRAPEVLLAAPEYSRTVDMWSIGVMLIELLTGDCPFPGRSDDEQLREIFQSLGVPDDRELPAQDQSIVDTMRSMGAVDSETRRRLRADSFRLRALTLGRWTKDCESEEAADFAARCLVYDAGERLRPEDALAHPFLRPLGLRARLPLECALIRDEELLEARLRAAGPDFLGAKGLDWSKVQELFAWIFKISDALSQPLGVADLACLNFVRCTLSKALTRTDVPRAGIVACVCVLLASKTLSGSDYLASGEARDAMLARICGCTMRDMQAYEMAVLHSGLGFAVIVRTPAAMLATCMQPCPPRARMLMDAWLLLEPRSLLERGRAAAVHDVMACITAGRETPTLTQLQRTLDHERNSQTPCESHLILQARYPDCVSKPKRIKKDDGARVVLTAAPRAVPRARRRHGDADAHGRSGKRGGRARGAAQQVEVDEARDQAV